jgi:hypothetical protein
VGLAALGPPYTLFLGPPSDPNPKRQRENEKYKGLAAGVYPSSGIAMPVLG